MSRLGPLLGLASLIGMPIVASCGGSSEDGDSGFGSDSGSGSSSTTGGGPRIVDEVPDGGRPVTSADPTAPPTIVGGGSNSAPLGEGCGPETAAACHPVGGNCNPGVLAPDHQVLEAHSVCFYSEEADEPKAVAEYVTEVQNGQEYIHLRVTFDPNFVDNTYGACATGWGGDEDEAAAEPEPEPMPDDPMGEPKPMKPPKKKGGHTFGDLVGSDHVELMLSDCDGNLAMHLKLDYISEGSTSCGYINGGVTVGDGKVIVGSADDVLAASSSLDRNMNGCGYCETENSPCPGENFASNSDAPEWDYRVVYEVWIDADAFGSSGFCGVDIDSVHASPSKADSNTVDVEPKDCPPPPCPPSYQLYLTSEGEQVCVPTSGCPDGTVIDLTSEGEDCIPIE